MSHPPYYIPFGDGRYCFSVVFPSERVASSTPNKCHDRIIHSLWRRDAMLTPLLIKQGLVNAVSEPLDLQARLMKEIELGIPFRWKGNLAELLVSPPPLFGELVEKPQRILPVDGRNQFWGTVMAGV